MDIEKLISRYYRPSSLSCQILLEHGAMVSEKACEIGRKMKLSASAIAFIDEASFLHDIGIFLTDSPQIGCYGSHQYVAHGYLGSKILIREGLPKHARVCESHVGVGLSAEDIESQKLPLPRKDMLPVSLEEKIICYADKFFSKKAGNLCREKQIEEIRKEIGNYGMAKLEAFDALTCLFSK